jgi:endo-1,4-beta-xylanase
VNPFRISSANHTNAQRLAGLGLEISITEMDIRIQLPTDMTELQQQALAYGDAITFCLAEPNCAAVVTWGFTDKFSWVPGTFGGFGDALVFDASYQPKAAYTAMQSVLEGGVPAPPPPPPPPPPPNNGVTVTPVVAASGPWFNEQRIQIANMSGIAALNLTITIQRTGGVSFSGQYNTVGGSITQSHATTTTAVTYQFTSTAGQTLGPSNNLVFAAQTSGSGTVHPTAGDTYTLTYTTGGQSFTRSGSF